MLSEISKALADKQSFTRPNSQVFDKSVIINAYDVNECELVELVAKVPVEDVPCNSNVTLIQVIYKLKFNDDKLLIIYSRIAPLGNYDSNKTDLRTKFCMCYPCSFRIFLSILSLRFWHVSKAYKNPAFLKTVRA